MMIQPHVHAGTERRRRRRTGDIADGAVIAGIGPVDEMEPVVKVASHHAAALGSRLVLCRVLSEVPPDDAEPEAREAYERAILELREMVRACCPDDVLWAVEIRAGDVAGELAACAERHHAPLLVVGEAARAEGWFRRTFRPGVTTEVLRSASCPVLVTRGATRPSCVVIATSMRDGEVEALADGAALLGEPDDLFVLHCVPTLPPVASPEIAIVAASTAVQSEIVDAADQRLQHELDQLDCDARPVVRSGEPGAVLVDVTAELEPDVIVVGRHPGTSLERVVAAPLCERMVHDAPCDVLVLDLSPEPPAPEPPEPKEPEDA